MVRKWKILKQKKLFHNRRYQVVQDKLLLPNSKKIYYTYIRMRDYAGVVSLTQENKVLLNYEYQHPARQFVYEIPSGSIEKGENPIEAAKRELREETGFEATNVTRLGEFFLSNGSITQKAHIFFAKASKRKVSSRDATEFIMVRQYPVRKILRMVVENKITDAASVIGILLAYKKGLIK